MKKFSLLTGTFLAIGLFFSLNTNANAESHETVQYAEKNDSSFNGEILELRSQVDRSYVIDNGADTGIILWRVHGGANQRWVFELDEKTDTYTIENVAKGDKHYLYETTNKKLAFSDYTSDPNKIGDDTRWKVINISKDVYEIVNYRTGNRIDVLNGHLSVSDGTPIQTWTQNGTKAQQWYLPKSDTLTTLNGEVLEYETAYSIYDTNKRKWDIVNEFDIETFSSYNYVKISLATSDQFFLISKTGKTGPVMKGDEFYIYSLAYDYSGMRYVGLQTRNQQGYAFLDNNKHTFKFEGSGTYLKLLMNSGGNMRTFQTSNRGYVGSSLNDGINMNFAFGK